MSHSARRLHTWDQFAPRAYMRQVFCFPYRPGSGDGVEPVRQSLETALARVAKDWPEFAGRVGLEAGSSGRLVVSSAPGDSIALDVVDDGSSSSWNYTHLRAAGFPARAFVGPSVDLPGPPVEDGRDAPVTKILARVIRGGLLLNINIHHSLTDGAGMMRFVSSLAAHTRRLEDAPRASPSSADADLPAGLGAVLTQSLTFEELIQRCPEFRVLPAPTGPLAFRPSPASPHYDSVPKTGRIFVFGPETTALLKRAAQRWKPDESSPVGSRCHYPSTFACLAALTWAHTTAARLRTNLVMEQPPEVGTHYCRILLPASWAKRAFANMTSHYTGNAVGMVEVKTGLDSLLAAACSSPDSLLATGQAYALLVHLIETSLAGLDQDFVTTRTAMMRAAPDPRLIGVNIDPQDPHDFIFNSWRHLGADIRWGMPGIEGEERALGGGVLADAVRRAQNVWNMGAGLIMPGHKKCNKYELLVTLDEMSLKSLCLDPSWRSWVDGVVD